MPIVFATILGAFIGYWVREGISCMEKHQREAEEERKKLLAEIAGLKAMNKK